MSYKFESNDYLHNKAEEIYSKINENKSRDDNIFEIQCVIYKMRDEIRNELEKRHFECNKKNREHHEKIRKEVTKLCEMLDLEVLDLDEEIPI